MPPFAHWLEVEFRMLGLPLFAKSQMIDLPIVLESVGIKKFRENVDESVRVKERGMEKGKDGGS